jgi:hypothetical protein
MQERILMGNDTAKKKNSSDSPAKLEANNGLAWAGIAAIGAALIGNWWILYAADPNRTGSSDAISDGPKFLAWIVSSVLLFSALALFGLSSGRGWGGLLIDSRHKFSSSRLQIILWTVIVLSTVISVVGFNVVSGASEPIGFTIPGNVLAVIGVSVAGFAGSSLVKSTKNTKNLHRNSDHTKANVRNLIEAEDDKSEVPGLEVSKVQMLAFTFVSVAAYSYVVLAWFADAKVASDLASFPDFSEGMLALIAISHGGYLGYKAAPNKKLDGES